MKFERTTKYTKKLFMEALADKKVHTDVVIKIGADWSKGGKLRAWCDTADSWLQFPNKLRYENARYIADVIEVKSKNRESFFRVVKGSIRNPNGKVVG